MLIATSLASCRPQQLIPPTDDAPQHNTTQIEYRDKLIRDTTYILDSVYIREKADTIFVTRWREKYTERIQTDTLYSQRTDTLRLVKRVYYKEPLSKFEQTKMWIGGISLWLLLILLLLVAGWGIWKVRKII